MRQCYRAIIEYDGTRYRGFQWQQSGPTIQGAIEAALQTISGNSIRIIGAGRTDAGVHALGQVISFELDWPESHGLEALQRALNANLADDIVVLQLTKAAAGFHPRFDARRRTYHYLIYNAPVRRPLYRRHYWHVIRSLDVNRMNKAAAQLVGTHDFATFGRPPQGESTTRDVYQAVWQQEKAHLCFVITANAFLFRMVRSLVGSLVAVGMGKWTLAQFADAFQSHDRSRSASAAPAHGLYLVSIDYEDKKLAG